MRQAFGYGGLAPFGLDLKLKDDSLLTLVAVFAVEPDEQEIGAFAAEAVFALDAAAAIDDALQVGLEEELRSGLLVKKALDPCLVAGAEPKPGYRRSVNRSHRSAGLWGVSFVSPMHPAGY